MNIFEKAVREKTRFNFKGNISVEDLWDLSLENLDKIWGDLGTELESLPKRSLLSTKSDQRDEIEFKQSIIKYIVDTKKAEREAEKAAKANSAKKQLILEIIEDKKHEALKTMSVEELTHLAETL